MKYFFCYETSIGKIYIYENNKKIVNINFKKLSDEEYLKKETLIIKETIKQIQLYLEGKLTKFDIDIDIELEGTEFQRQVWNELLKIPYGECRTYKDIAEKIGRDKAYRAVGNANNKNPISIIIPCHRVIGSSGNMVGYAGGLDIKKKLLQIEEKYKD